MLRHDQLLYKKPNCSEQLEVKVVLFLEVFFFFCPYMLEDIFILSDT